MYNQSFFLYEEEMFLSGDIYIFVFFGESKSFKICELVVKLRVLRSIRMKFGQILVSVKLITILIFNVNNAQLMFTCLKSATETLEKSERCSELTIKTTERYH